LYQADEHSLENVSAGVDVLGMDIMVGEVEQGRRTNFSKGFRRLILSPETFSLTRERPSAANRVLLSFSKGSFSKTIPQ
jgi:hypothetical protein